MNFRDPSGLKECIYSPWEEYAESNAEYKMIKTVKGIGPSFKNAIWQRKADVKERRAKEGCYMKCDENECTDAPIDYEYREVNGKISRKISPAFGLETDGYISKKADNYITANPWNGEGKIVK